MYMIPIHIDNIKRVNTSIDLVLSIEISISSEMSKSDIFTSVKKWYLSHDTASGSEITPCNKPINHQWFTDFWKT